MYERWQQRGYTLPKQGHDRPDRPGIGARIASNAAAWASALQDPPVEVVNRHGRGPVLLLCEHASCFIPPPFAGLGLGEADLRRHIAWDIGALETARHLSAMLDAPLAHATYSRLLLDLNRPTDAHDCIVETSEGTHVPGNVGLDPEARRHRHERIHEPFHAEVTALLDQRLQANLPTTVISIHSFTPRYHGVQRPWHVGVIARHDRELALELLDALRADSDLCVGDNQPYAPEDGVYHSMERHGELRGLHAAMIEVRQDLLADDEGCRRWAQTLRFAIESSLRRLPRTPARLAAAR